VFAWTGRLCAAKGWRYEVWSGAPAVLLSNIRWLGQARRPQLIDRNVADMVRRTGRPGVSIGQVVSDCSHWVRSALALHAVLSCCGPGCGYRPAPPAVVRLDRDRSPGYWVSDVVELRSGVRLWFEGSLWTVQEVRSDRVVLAGGEQRMRSVALGQLVRVARPPGGPDNPS